MIKGVRKYVNTRAPVMGIKGDTSGCIKMCFVEDPETIMQHVRLQFTCY